MGQKGGSMYRILTGICCAVWCAVIAFEAFGVDNRLASVGDTELASYFTDEFTEDVTAQLRLCGSAPEWTSEEEIASYLEGAAHVCKIDSGYGIIKKQESYGRVWELAGANGEISYSLKYLKKDDGTENAREKENKEAGETRKNDCLISWSFTGDWSEKMQVIYKQKTRLEEYSKTKSALCLELIGEWNTLLTDQEISKSAKTLMQKVGAAVVTTQKQDNLQLYYGYAEALGEGIRFQNKKANVNLLYRTDDKKTRCILGFPAVLWDE